MDLGLASLCVLSTEPLTPLGAWAHSLGQSGPNVLWDGQGDTCFAAQMVAQVLQPRNRRTARSKDYAWESGPVNTEGSSFEGNSCFEDTDVNPHCSILASGGPTTVSVFC